MGNQPYIDENSANQLRDIKIREIEAKIEKLDAEDKRFYPAIQKDIAVLLEAHAQLGKITAELTKKIEVLEKPKVKPLAQPRVLNVVKPDTKTESPLAVLLNLFKRKK